MRAKVGDQVVKLQLGVVCLLLSDPALFSCLDCNYMRMVSVSSTWSIRHLTFQTSEILVITNNAVHAGERASHASSDSKKSISMQIFGTHSCRNASGMLRICAPQMYVRGWRPNEQLTDERKVGRVLNMVRRSVGERRTVRRRDHRLTRCTLGSARRKNRTGEKRRFLTQATEPALMAVAHEEGIVLLA